VSRPFVFVSCGATTAPLIPLLARRFTFVVPDAATAERLCAQGTEAVGWGVLADPRRMAELPAVAERLAREWRAGLEREPELFAVAGRHRADVLVPAVEELLRGRLATQLAVVEFGRALARSGRLAGVVVHEDVTAPVRALLEAVRPFGVPSVHVPHGVYADERLVGADVHGVAHTDVVAVAGEVEREWFLRRGVLPARLVVTGNPAWDPLCGRPRQSAAVLGLPPGRVVTVTTTWLGADSADHGGIRAAHERQLRAGLKAIASLQARHPDLHLVLKLHPSAPSGEEERLARLAAEAGARVGCLLRDRLPDVLAASDVLLTLPSTVAVEAVVAGTPVVAIEFFFDGDAVLTVPAEVGAIAAALADVLAGSGRSAGFAARRRQFVARYNGPSDGRAAERVARLVENLAAAAERRETDGAAALGERLAQAERLAESGAWAGTGLLLDDEPAAVADAPLAGRYWTLRGEALSRLGRRPAAERSFRAAIDAGAGARALAGLGLLLLEHGEHREAETCLLHATALDAGNDWAWCGLGVLAAARGDAGLATQHLERALAVNPANADARRALGIVRGRVGDAA